MRRCATEWRAPSKDLAWNQCARILRMAGDGLREGKPVVLRRGPHRAHRRREVRIGKGADRDADDVGQALVLPEDGRAALGRNGKRARRRSRPGGGRCCARPRSPQSAGAGRRRRHRTASRCGAGTPSNGTMTRHLAHRSCECAIGRRSRRPRVRRVLSFGQLATDWSHRRGGGMPTIAASLMNFGSTEDWQGDSSCASGRRSRSVP